MRFLSSPPTAPEIRHSFYGHATKILGWKEHSTFGDKVHHVVKFVLWPDVLQGSSSPSLKRTQHATEVSQTVDHKKVCSSWTSSLSPFCTQIQKKLMCPTLSMHPASQTLQEALQSPQEVSPSTKPTFHKKCRNCKELDVFRCERTKEWHQPFVEPGGQCRSRGTHGYVIVHDVRLRCILDKKCVLFAGQDYDKFPNCLIWKMLCVENISMWNATLYTEYEGMKKTWQFGNTGVVYGRTHSYECTWSCTCWIVHDVSDSVTSVWYTFDVMAGYVWCV